MERLRDFFGVHFRQLRLVGRASVARSKKVTFRGPSNFQSCPFRILSVAGPPTSVTRARPGSRLPAPKAPDFSGILGVLQSPIPWEILMFPLPYRPPHIHVWGPIFGESEGVRSGVGFSAAGALTPLPPSPPPATLLFLWIS